MGNALITVNTDFYEDGYELTINWVILKAIFVSILIGIGSVYYIYRQKQCQRKIIQNEEHLTRCEGTIMNSSDGIIPIKKVEIHYDVCIFSIPKYYIACIASVDIYATSTIEINKPLNQISPSIEERKLICYCDGSYSHYMQIGYAGFRASNGAYRIRFFSSHDPRCGSTNTEVLAACLAIQYALDKNYNTLIIYTDNSKVEQLLKRPKEKDKINYPNICQILNQYQKQKGNNMIRVIRVRGHTSIYEQRKCETKHEFAKIDRAVRKKTRQYIRRYWTNFQQNCYYWYKPVYHSYSIWKVLGHYA
jgi:ribonuclease HI